MTGTRFLIVNADDFGQSRGINRGIIQAHENGIVTSASLMVRWPSAADAAEYGRSSLRLSVGLHIDLGEWFYRNGDWQAVYQVVDYGDADAARREILRQLEVFRSLIGKDPTHLDSHQHLHLREPIRPVVLDLAETLKIPVRGCTPSIGYCGSFYGQTAEGKPLPGAVSREGLLKILRKLPAGWTELGCHPACGNDLNTMYRIEREQELESLCDPAVRAAIEQETIKLRSFKGLRDA